jgi:hypothetical protein
MGIGTVALKDRRFSYFSRGCTTTVLGADRVEKIFSIDSRMLWARGNSPSVPLTWCLERVNDWYMRWPVLQYLLHLGSSAKRILGLNPVFEAVPPVAEVRFTYRIAENRIDVSCTVHPLSGRLPSVFILSELAADVFTRGFSQGKETKPPSGWARHETGNDLYDPAHRLIFTLFLRWSSVPSTAWWGREHMKNLRWAGYSLEFPRSEGVKEPVSCSYTVCLHGVAP